MSCGRCCHDPEKGWSRQDKDNVPGLNRLPPERKQITSCPRLSLIDYNRSGMRTMNAKSNGGRLATLFFSYSHVDENLRDQLEIHLSSLRRQGLIDSWHDRRITAGEEFGTAIDGHIDTADVILLLISRTLLPVVTRTDLIAQQSFEGPGSCSSRHRRADSV